MKPTEAQLRRIAFDRCIELLRERTEIQRRLIQIEAQILELAPLADKAI